MSFDEEAYLASVSTQAEQSEPTSRNKYLILHARKLYPKFFERMKSLGKEKILEDLMQKCADDTPWETVVEAGEVLLVQKVEADLQLKIESIHHSIAQLTANIGKLTG